MNEDARKVIEAAQKLQQGIDRSLEETEYEDQETLQEWQELQGRAGEGEQQLQQAMYRQRLRSVKRDPAFMAKLKKRGLTAEKFVDMESNNPNAFAESYQEGMENYLDRLQGKKGKKKGSDPFFAQQTLKAHPANVEKARARAKKSRGSDDDFDAVLGALMGFDD